MEDCETSDLGFFTYFLWDYEIESGKTVADFFVAKNFTRLDRAERAYIERMRASHMGLYEIAEIELDRGLWLIDLLSGERLWVRERLATHQVHRLQVIGARTMLEMDGQRVFDGTFYVFTPTQGYEARAFLMRERATYLESHPNADNPNFLKNCGASSLDQYWVDHIFLAPLPKFVTFDGDEIALCEMTFTVYDRAALRAAFTEREDFVQEDINQWSWVREWQPESERLVFLATLRLRIKSLTVDTKSRERAERIRTLLNKIAGDALEFRKMKVTDVDAERLSQEEPTTLPRTPRLSREQREESEAALERFYEEWLDLPVPMLDNLSPRQAIQHSELRPRVVLLLKEITYNMESKRAPGQAAPNADRLWKELGLTPSDPCDINIKKGHYGSEEEDRGQTITVDSFSVLE